MLRKGMSLKQSALALFSIVLALLGQTAYAHTDGINVTSKGAIRADGHAPIGVMGDHRHKQGEWMVSYRYKHMSMQDNRDGRSDLSPEEIATTVPNRFFGLPMQPPTLRVIPTEMSMDMHMFGLMYAPSEQLTLMAMAMYVQKEMDHITFKGPMGSERLGEFTTKSSGFSDTRISGLIRLYEDATPPRTPESGA